MHVKILNIGFNPKRINKSDVAREANLNQGYVNQIINGDRKCPRATDSLEKVRDAIIKLYCDVVKIDSHQTAN